MLASLIAVGVLLASPVRLTPWKEHDGSRGGFCRVVAWDVRNFRNRAIRWAIHPLGYSLKAPHQAARGDALRG